MLMGQSAKNAFLGINVTSLGYSFLNPTANISNLFRNNFMANAGYISLNGTNNSIFGGGATYSSVVKKTGYAVLFGGAVLQI